ncbi:hypothetical protein [Massilia sp. YMA4]|uniref:Type-F conjugative transfer system protein TrbI n=1 Tax=[Empedobacter] haloabium TaxID=592317 RepID=A0ABZ1UTN6_9BURK|nr:hypothetical protein [Massilia sp. YMA4]AXA91342.1 hypothetical protein DPH57_09370 [Massilia sp. YMA4]
MNAHLTCIAASLACSAGLLAAYDTLVARPARTIGVVDTLAVFRAEEERLAALMTSEMSSQQRERISADAQRFASAFPAALEQIAAHCRCVVIERTALIGTPPHLVDLTPELRKRMGQQ